MLLSSFIQALLKLIETWLGIALFDGNVSIATEKLQDKHCMLWIEYMCATRTVFLVNKSYKVERFFLLWINVFSGFLKWLHFPLLVFKDQIFFTLCLLFVPEEKKLYLLRMLVVFSVIFCTFSVLWNIVAVFQFNISLPHCIGKFV